MYAQEVGSDQCSDSVPAWCDCQRAGCIDGSYRDPRDITVTSTRRGVTANLANCRRYASLNWRLVCFPGAGREWSWAVFIEHVMAELVDIDRAGLTKRERLIAGPQGSHVRVAGRDFVNLCANNYLGLANHPDVVAAAKRGLDEYGFGMSSVRFICGAQTLHRELELRIARYLQKDDAILLAACFDANAAVFEPLFDAGDAIVSDSLNHASIIDGIRLSKAKRYRYSNGNMDELESCLRSADRDGSRFKLVVTDGVFSMDGHLANLSTICDLAVRHGAMVMVDDCHATGHLGENGRGTPALTGTEDRIDILTGTLGKTLGGAMGGFIAAAQPIIDLLRQRARPYLFRNK